MGSNIISKYIVLELDLNYSTTWSCNNTQLVCAAPQKIIWSQKSSVLNVSKEKNKLSFLLQFMFSTNYPFKYSFPLGGLVWVARIKSLKSAVLVLLKNLNSLST